MLKAGLLVSILSVITTSSVFSQNDTTRVHISVPIARLVIKDLIKGDAAVQEINLLEAKVNLLEEKTAAQDSVIALQKQQLDNLTRVLENKDGQMKVQQELVVRVQKDLKITRAKNTVLKASNGIAIVGIVVSLIL